MSGTGESSSLLVIGNRVYCKKDDHGAFYPASVESKNNRYYTVKFADGARKRVLEKELVWLAFWGLPAFRWPEYPIVQPSELSDDIIFEGKIRFLGTTAATDGETPGPNLFELRKTNGTAANPLDTISSVGWPAGDQQSHCSDGISQGCVPLSNEREILQPRSTVLRLNEDLLQKESLPDYQHRLSCPSQKANFVFRQSFNLEAKNVIGRQNETNDDYPSSCPSLGEPGYFQESLDSKDSLSVERSSNPRGRMKTQYNSDLHVNGNESHKARKLTNQPETKPRLFTAVEVVQKKSEEQNSPTLHTVRCTRDWTENVTINTDQWNIISPTPPRCSTGYISLQSSVFGEIPRTFSSVRSPIVKSLQIHNEVPGKKIKRREETKKCRRVFGIMNRDAWCAQCRWKKACSKFKE